jgi:uncharacterized protein (TIGR02246 family)
MPEADTPEQLYWTLLGRWNARDASGFAALFEDEGHTIGFDGSEMHGRSEIERTLGVSSPTTKPRATSRRSARSGLSVRTSHSYALSPAWSRQAGAR